MAKHLPDQKNTVLVSIIIAPHGVGGAVSAECLSDNPRRFAVGAEVFDEKGQVYVIKQASPHKGRLLITFAGIDNRDAAEKLRGVHLYAVPSPEDQLPEGEYYHYQLIGLEVLEKGESLGILTEVLRYTANDVFKVEKEGCKELLIPALKAIVKKVDIDNGIMEVELPEGLR